MRHVPFELDVAERHRSARMFLASDRMCNALDLYFSLIIILYVMKQRRCWRLQCIKLNFLQQ